MPINFRCARCQHSLTRKDSEAGTKVQCPACNQKLLVPTPPRLADKTMLGVLQPAPDPRTMLGQLSSSPPASTTPSPAQAHSPALPVAQPSITPALPVAQPSITPALPVAQLHTPASQPASTDQEPWSFDASTTSRRSRYKPSGRTKGRPLISFRGLAVAAGVLILGFVLLCLVMVGVNAYNSSSRAAREQAALSSLRTTPELKGRLEAAFAVQSSYTRDQLLEGIARDAASQGEAEVVKLTLSKLDSSYTRDRLAEEAALRLAEKGYNQGATEVARVISSSFTRDQVLEKIAKGKGRLSN